MTAIVNVNGRITDERQATVSVFDHGFLYGEGVYETLRTYGSARFCSSVTCEACDDRRR